MTWATGPARSVAGPTLAPPEASPAPRLRFRLVSLRPSSSSPSGPNVSSTVCQATGTCAIIACTANRFDTNGNYSDGCECLMNTVTSMCTTAVGLGTMGPGSTQQVTCTLPQPNTERWYTVSCTGGGNFSMALTSNPSNQFRIDTKGTCASPGYNCQQGGTSDGLVSFQFGQAPGGLPTCSISSLPSPMLIRVYG